MTKKSKSPKRAQPVCVSSVIWESPSAIYAVDNEAARDQILRRHDVPPVEWMHYLTRPDNEGAQPAIAEVQYYDGGALCIVCFGPEMFKVPGLHVNAMLTITHEAVHVFQRICELLGEEAPGHEVEAYAIERITQNLIDAYMTLQDRRVRAEFKEHLEAQTPTQAEAAV
jgi:hypothetical protein